MGAGQSREDDGGLTMVKTEPTHVRPRSTMNPDKIRGLTRLFTEESRRRHDKDRDELDEHKDNMLLLKQMYKKMDPTIMKTATYTTHGEVELAFKYMPTRETMLVKVIRARDLNAKDLRGKSAEPYVQMFIHPSEEHGGVMRTQTASKTLNPTYHEIFTIPISDKEINQSTLVVQVWDRDVIGKDDLIGEALVSLGTFNFLSQPTHTAWHELRAETDLKISGELEISLRYKLPETLLITMHAATNLTNRYESGAPNPFVKIAIPGIQTVFKTKTKFNTVDPKWEETFEIEVPQEEFGYRYIVLHCVDFEKGTGNNESLGQVIIDLNNFVPEDGLSGSFQLQDLKNSERLRSRWFQHTTMQEFRESLIAHAAVRYPKVVFNQHYGSKVLKLKSVKAGSNARLRLMNGILVY